MDDFYLIKKFKLLIAIIIILILSFITYRLLSNMSNTNFNKYLNDNNYIEEKNNIKTLTKESDNTKITYLALYENNILTKTIITSNDEFNETKTIKLYYKKNKSIIIEYEFSNIINNEFKMSSSKAIFKNGKIKNYEIITGNNDENIEELEQEAKKYYEEMEKIFKENKIIPQLIKTAS